MNAAMDAAVTERLSRCPRCRGRLLPADEGESCCICCGYRRYGSDGLPDAEGCIALVGAILRQEAREEGRNE